MGRKLNIIIFDVTGFIGRNIIEKFTKNKNYNIVGTYNSSKP